MQNVETGRTLAATVHDLIATLIDHGKRGNVTAKHLKAVFYATRRPFPEAVLNPKESETWYRVFGIEHGRSRVPRDGRPLRTEDLSHLPAVLRTLGLAAETEFASQSDPLSWCPAIDRVAAALRRPLSEDEVRFPDPPPLLPVPDPSPTASSLIGDVLGTIETNGRAVIVGASEAQRGALAYAVAARMETTGCRVAQVDARTRLGFAEPATGSEAAAGYARLWADIFATLLDHRPERTLAPERWKELAQRLDQLIKTAPLQRAEQTFVRSVRAAMRDATRSRELRDGLERRGDAFRTPKLLAALAPAVRGLLGNTLIVIHGAEQFDAAKEIVAALLGNWDDARRTPDLCLLVTSPRRRGFAFLDEPGAGIVHDLPTAAGATNTEHGRTDHRPLDVPPDRTTTPSRTHQARPAVRLTRFLDAKARQPGLAIALEPGGSHIQGRLIVAPPAVPLLRAGSHLLRYTSSFSAQTGLYLLLLEHDRKKDDWYLINAIADAQLPLDRRMPASGVHATPLDVQQVAGTYDLYAIASAAGFDNQLEIIAEAVANAPDRKLDETMLDDLAEVLIEIVETDREGAFATARFSYRVDA